MTHGGSYFSKPPLFAFEAIVSLQKKAYRFETHMESSNDNPNSRWTELMKRAQDGDENSYKTLLNEIYPVIRNVLKSKIGRLGEDEDLIQECIIGIHSARATYDPNRPFEPWMFTIVKYKMIDFMRKYQRLAKREVFDELVLATIPDEQANNPVENQGLERFDGVLSPEMKTALELTKVQGLSTKEAAEREGISEVALRTRISRAYKVLRAHIESEKNEQ